MARFLPPDAFSAATEDLSLLPFNLERIGTSQYLVANMVGDFASTKRPTRLIWSPGPTRKRNGSF
jgi:hypothetical protein